MTALPDEPHRYTVPYDPGRRYTVEEFAQLPEDNTLLYELQEGIVVVSPRATTIHMRVMRELLMRIQPQLPPHLEALTEINVDLDFSPAVVRIPDLVVDLVDLAGVQTTKASAIQLVVEVISPGSVRTDTVVKPMEYAEAGIPHFWLVDPKPPVTVNVFRLMDGHYEESQRVEHLLVVDEPCPLQIDLDDLAAEARL